MSIAINDNSQDSKSSPGSRARGRDRAILAYVVAFFLALHGLIHALGFAATWGIGQVTAVSASPSLFPGLAAGSLLVRFIGLLWLVTMAAFLGSAIALASNFPQWRAWAAVAALVSLALCIAWWNDAKFGAIPDSAILLGVLVAARVARAARA